jgi:hypothetical protein
VRVFKHDGRAANIRRPIETPLSVSQRDGREAEVIGGHGQLAKTRLCRRIAMTPKSVTDIIGGERPVIKTLDASPSHLIAREQSQRLIRLDMRALHGLTAPPAPRAVMLSGARQIGKTTLMLQATHLINRLPP